MMTSTELKHELLNNVAKVLHNDMSLDEKVTIVQYEVSKYKEKEFDLKLGETINELKEQDKELMMYGSRKTK